MVTRKKTTRAKKPTPSKSRAKKIKEEKGERNVPAVVGGESDTFVTLKKKVAMLKALDFHMGLVSQAALDAKVSRKTHYRWLESDPGYKEEYENILEATFDFVEGSMLKKIKAGDTIMTIWYSKTKMKARGFVERTELEVTEKPSFVVKDSDKGVSKVMDVIHKKTGTNNKQP